MMQMNSGSIHDIRQFHPQPTILGSGRLGASTLAGAGDKFIGKKVSDSLVEGDN
jgi:hypothetical protein